MQNHYRQSNNVQNTTKTHKMPTKTENDQEKYVRSNYKDTYHFFCCPQIFTKGRNFVHREREN